jgi:hypothetical protein
LSSDYAFFEREITGVMHFHAWHVPQLYYFREEVCFMYLQLQNQIAKSNYL